MECRHHLYQDLHLKGIYSLTLREDCKGRATDNICIEHFWRSAKVERVYLNEYQKSIKLNQKKKRIA
jgi:putative transposase